MQLYHINLCEAAYFKNTGLSEGLIFYMLILFQLLLQKCHAEKSVIILILYYIYSWCRIEAM